jgi:hypothetical protein
MSTDLFTTKDFNVWITKVIMLLIRIQKFEPPWLAMSQWIFVKSEIHKPTHTCCEQAVLQFIQSEQHVKGKMKLSDFCFFERWLPITLLFKLERFKKLIFAAFMPLYIVT